VEVNEISWNISGDLFYLTTGQGTIKIFDYPSFKLMHTLRAHTANCYCIEMDPRGRYLAAGSADATISLWDLESYTCLRSFTELRYVIFAYYKHLQEYIH
jgi:THO complex subunit 3